MKKALLALCISLSFKTLWAQNKTVDSLIRVALADTTKVDFYPNRDSLFKRLPFVTAPAARIKLIYEIINYGRDVSTSGLSYHYKIADWAKKNHDPISQAVVTAEIGFNISVNGDNTTGIKTCFDALNLAEQTGNKQAIGIAYINLEVCYSDNISLAKFYGQKGLHFSMAGNNDLYTAYGLLNLATNYRHLHKIDSSKYYLLKAFTWCVSKHVKIETARTLADIGEITADNERLTYYRAAERIAAAYGDKENVSYALLFIGSWYQQHNRLDSALFYARKIYNGAGRLSLRNQLSPIDLLSKSFTKSQPDSTLKYTLLYYKLRDSLQSIGKMQQAQSMAFADEQNRNDMTAQQVKYQANLRFYVLAVVVAFLLLLAFIFWRNNRQSKQANKLLQQQKDQVQQTLHELKTTQSQLVQREKMASLGELTAGIAHEIQNPLNFVNNFSEVNKEMIDELKTELKNGDVEEALAIADGIQQNEEKINHHGKRADFIVKGMLLHSRNSSGEKEPTNINTLAEEFLKLSYQGLRAKDKNFNAALVTNFDKSLPMVNIAHQDIGRVLLNMFNNAFYAVNQKQKTARTDYKPGVSVSTSLEKNNLVIKIKDNGNGIPDAIKEKIMQPFFTTKPTGEGTGLGLSLSYDIVVKGHGGTITVNTVEGEFTEFTVTLPL